MMLIGEPHHSASFLLCVKSAGRHFMAPHSDKNMHTEMQKLGAEKNSADKNAHYNVCMVLKIKQQDAIVLLLQA
ncbi:MAG: hypothetical protein IJN23_06640, partial [Akkermansia sp.]|nr:hypothetical protein [Akkermansia sp.]